jgi:hypothetical protein
MQTVLKSPNQPDFSPFSSWQIDDERSEALLSAKELPAVKTDKPVPVQRQHVNQGRRASDKLPEITECATSNTLNQINLWQYRRPRLPLHGAYVPPSMVM